MRSRVFGCPAVVLACIAASCAHGASITVQAGGFERRHTPVSFNCSTLPAGYYALTGTDGESALLQVGPAGAASMIIGKLARDARVTYRVGELLAANSAPTGISVKSQPGGLDVSQNGKLVFHYQTEPGELPSGVPDNYRHGAYLHPVFSPGGKLMTADFPPDHRHQRGIFFAWTKTEFDGGHPDYWNMGKDKDGKLTGEVRFERVERTWSGPVQGGFVSRHKWFDHSTGIEREVLRETWEVAVFPPARSAAALQLLDLISTQSCAGEKPLKLPKYHYGGLGVRGSAQWDPKDKVTMRTSEGHDRKTGDATKAKWVHMDGEIDGAAAGIAVLIHPGNFRFPQPLRLNPNNPQLCVAPSQDGDWEISPGKPYVSQYRLVFYDGTVGNAEMERLWNDFAHPPQVTVSTQ